MKLTNKGDDTMLERASRIPVYAVRIGEGTDPRWLQVKAEKEAAYIKWLLDGCPGFMGVMAVWPRNIAVFDSGPSALAGKNRLEEADIKTGDVMTADAMPGLTDIEIKKKWEEIK